MDSYATDTKLDVFGVNWAIVLAGVDKLILGKGAAVCDLDLVLELVVELLVLSDNRGKVRSRNNAEVGRDFHQSDDSVCRGRLEVPVGFIAVGEVHTVLEHWGA